VSVTLSCGDYSETTEISGPGAFKINMSFASSTSGCQISATMNRNGIYVVNFAPVGFIFDRNPSLYNFNAFVAVSP
jgi:glucan endo-1,3-alpha-glucosidase